MKSGAVRPPADPLRILEVIESLRVGPVQIDRNRLTAPYEVVGSRGTERTELIYRFEEDVFEPGEALSHNLADMIAAQVALNYGLFCREIVFRGSHDRHDRAFIEEHAARTAREIYVNKFLKPNPFLVGPAASLPVLRARSYLRSRIVFEKEADGRGLESGADSGAWETDSSRYAVLSSGGKDSLLSYGLLAEIGCETHSVFVNESGRHWFTALNAYRHFATNVPNTTRVWTNADRVFTWMLRQLPFVREDFGRIRSDDYPIRLWTVAVFLFGALPIVRKRRIERIVIGDEYDTTLRVSHQGVTHYAGLYDQSRYFDNAMTRYFRRKRWGLSQFSILRPLSELAILKTLVERYPDLQRLQVSCHATHTEGDTVRPCGQCEKCRRIVGMLVSLGADPGRCGYTPQQVAACLAELPGRSLHQEAPGVAHLLHLLQEKGLVPPGSGKPHPEVLKLRFDPDRSPYETIPRDLRRPLYTLLLQHADGAVSRHGREWISADALSDESLNWLYPFDQARPAAGASRSGQAEPPALVDGEHPVSAPHPYRLGDLTWPEAKARLREVDVALLPVGSTEQHGPHLPLDTDAHDAARLADEVAAACSHPQPLVLPSIPYGVSYHHDDFPGTISIGPDALSRMVIDVGMSAARNGITKLIIINGHGGNGPALHFAAQVINRDARIFTCVDTGESSDADIEALADTPNDVHAGEIETSTTLALRPDRVQMDRAEPDVPHFSSEYLEFSSRRGVLWYGHTSRISPSGVMGDPTKADPEKGRRIWQIMVRNLVELVEDIKGLSLDEIHERRY